MANVLITAGAAGIGRAMAEAFLARGDQVAIIDADKEAVATFSTANPAAIACTGDVTNEAAMADHLAAVDSKFGQIDVVCANAGIGGPAGRIEDIDYADWKATLDVNLGGAFLACRWAAPLMQAQKSGLILLTSSTAGLFGYPHRSPYAVAKWGIIGLMKTLAMELGPFGVRVNALCPGAVTGPRMDRVVAKEAASRGRPETEIRDLYVKGVSMKTWVTAEDIAQSALFLASSAGNKISGQTLAIDGHTETLDP